MPGALKFSAVQHKADDRQRLAREGSRRRSRSTVRRVIAKRAGSGHAGHHPACPSQKLNAMAASSASFDGHELAGAKALPKLGPPSLMRRVHLIPSLWVYRRLRRWPSGVVPSGPPPPPAQRTQPPLRFTNENLVLRRSGCSCFLCGGGTLLVNLFGAGTCRVRLHTAAHLGLQRSTSLMHSWCRMRRRLFEKFWRCVVEGYRSY